MWEDDNYYGGDGGFVGDSKRKKSSSKKVRIPNLLPRLKAPKRRRRRKYNDTSPIFDKEFLGFMFWFFLSTYLMFFGLFKTPMIFLYVYIPLILIVIYLKNTKPLWDLMYCLIIVSLCSLVIWFTLFLAALIFDWNIEVLLLGLPYFIIIPATNYVLCRFFDRIFANKE